MLRKWFDRNLPHTAIVTSAFAWDIFCRFENRGKFLVLLFISFLFVFLLHYIVSLKLEYRKHNFTKYWLNELTLLEKFPARSSQNHEQGCYATLLPSLVPSLTRGVEVISVASDGCCQLSYDPCAFCQRFSHWLSRRGVERCQAKQAGCGQEGKMTIAGKKDGRWSPGLCRMLSVDPQGAATLGN